MFEFMYKGKFYYNFVEFVMDRIGGIWKMFIMWRLKDKVMCYSEFKRDIFYIFDKMLIIQFRELESEGFIYWEVYLVVFLKVEYFIMDKGRICVLIIEMIRNYGFFLIEEVGIEY